MAPAIHMEITHMKLSKTAITVAVLAAIITTPAMAGPKPIKGRYKCKGTAVEKFNGLTLSTKIKAKAVTIQHGDARKELGIDVLTRGRQISFFAYAPDEYLATFKPEMKTWENWGYRNSSCACLADPDMTEDGLVSQNKNGRKFSIDVTQTWHEWKNPSIHSDRYILTCKR